MTTANRGTILNDDPPKMTDDVRNLRITQPHKWREILRGRGLKLPEDDTLPNRRKTVTRKNEVELTFDILSDRNTGRKVRNPETGDIVQEPGPRWKEHVDKVKKDRGYGKPRVKVTPDPVPVPEPKKPSPKRKTRRTRKGGAK